MSAKTMILLVLLAAGSALSELKTEQCHSCGCASSRMECTFFARECTKRACWCNEEYGGKIFRDGKECTKILQTGDVCTNMEYAECDNDNYCNSISLRCEAQIDLGEDCTTTSSCKGSARCEQESEDESEVCKCPSDRVVVDGECREALLGEECDSESSSMCERGFTCIVSSESSTQGVCGCSDGGIPLEFSQFGKMYHFCVHHEALVDQSLGELCTIDSNSQSPTARYCSIQYSCVKCHMDAAARCMTLDTV